MDLLRPGAAVLRVEELDHAHPGEAAPVAGGPELGERPLRPGRVGSDHTKMVTVLDNGGENDYRFPRR